MSPSTTAQPAGQRAPATQPAVRPTALPDGRSGTAPGPSRPGPGHPPTRPADRPRHASRTSPPLDRTATAERLVALLGRWYLDAQAGRVEVRQLRRLLTPTAEHRVRAAVLRARARQRLGERRPGTVLDVRRVLVQPAGDHYEALALVDDGLRTVAVTAVLHPTDDGGWLVSDLARPDDGVPALPAPLVREPAAAYATA